MSLLKDVKSWIGLNPDSTTAPDSVGRESPLFVYVKIPGNIQPIERGDRFEDPLQRALRQARLGDVTGGGSQLDDPDAEGRPRVEFCGIDIDLYDVERGLGLLQSELRRLQAPKGTLLLYELDGQEYERPLVDES